MEEICIACEDGEGAHSLRRFCVRERRRRWRTWRRIWRLGVWDEEAAELELEDLDLDLEDLEEIWRLGLGVWDEEAAEQTWDEMLFGGGRVVLGFDWNDVTAEQIRDEMLFTGGGTLVSFNDAPYEEIWDETRREPEFQ